MPLASAPSGAAFNPAALRAARHLAGLSREQLAARLGSSFNCIVRWENGYNTPRLDNLDKLAAALGCPVEGLLHKRSK